MIKGKYIVLEGLNGVGKSTQIKELARRLKAAGLMVRTFENGGQSFDLVSNELHMLTHDQSFAVDSKTKLLLDTATQTQLLKSIKAFVNNGIICLVEGGYLTSLALNYYGHSSSLDYEELNKLFDLATSEIKPDLTILLDVAIPELSKRYNQANKTNLDNVAFLERVRAGYLWEARQRDLPIIFTSGSSYEVSNKIWDLVSANLAINNHRQQIAISEDEIINDLPPVATRLAENSTFKAEVTEKSSFKLNIDSASQLLLAALNRLNVEFKINPAKNDRYYVPKTFDAKLKASYLSSLRNIDSKRKALISKLNESVNSKGNRTSINIDEECSGLLTPLASSQNITIFVPKNETVKLSQQLQSLDLAEACSLGQLIASKNAQTNSKARLQSPEKLNEGLVYLKKLVQSKTETKQAPSETEPVKLTSYWPRNELDIVSEILFEHMNVPLANTQKLVDSWAYSQKVSAITKTNIYLTEILKQIYYSWDIVWDFSVTPKLKQKMPNSRLIWQQPTPRYGYAIPLLVEKADLTDDFEEIFSLSLKLFSELEAAGHSEDAQYATLAGNKQRFRLYTSAFDLKNLNNDSIAKANASYRNLIHAMNELVANAHPIIAKHLIGLA